MRTSYRWIGTIALIASVECLSAAAGAEPASTRSAPPDTTPYVRPAVPEDVAPFGKPAIGPRVPECDQGVSKDRETTKRPPAPGAPSGKKRQRHSADEILKARDQAAKDAEKQQKDAEREAEKQAKENEKTSADDAQAAETARIAAMSHPDDQKMDDLTENPPEGSDVAQEQKETTKK